MVIFCAIYVDVVRKHRRLGRCFRARCVHPLVTVSSVGRTRQEAMINVMGRVFLNSEVMQLAVPCAVVNEGEQES